VGLVNGCSRIDSEALVRAASVTAIEQEPGLQDMLDTLKSVDLRPTRQRVALVRLTYRTGNRHVTAAMPYEETIRAGGKVTVATVYNNLNHLIDADLLRRVTIDGAKTYCDTNGSDHRHFDLESARVDRYPDHSNFAARFADPSGWRRGQSDRHRGATA